MQFYGITFMHPYKQSGRWQDVFDTECTYKYVFGWFLLHKYITMDGSKNANFDTMSSKKIEKFQEIFKNFGFAPSSNCRNTFFCHIWLHRG